MCAAGQSYGMMLAVQMGNRAQFDRIWKWTKRYMFNAEGRFAGYSWQCRFDGSRMSDGPASSDGEEWFVMALFFAAPPLGQRRGGIFNLRGRGAGLLRHMLHNNAGGDPTPSSRCSPAGEADVFVPVGAAASSPIRPTTCRRSMSSGPAGPPTRRPRLPGRGRRGQSQASPRCPVTGLMPDYAHFDGTPVPYGGHGDFLFDAFRTIGNVALDWSWFGKDPWQVEQSNHVLAFTSRRPNFFNNCPRQQALSADHSPGLFAMAAVGALAAASPDAQLFVERLGTCQQVRA